MKGVYKMKKFAGIILVLCLLSALTGCRVLKNDQPKDAAPLTAAKPVIYLYPEQTTEVEVKLKYSGELTCTYPAYNDGWRVLAQPDGTLTDVETGREYSYLYWEGEGYDFCDMTEGFVIRGEDTAAFLQTTLEKLGMMPREYNEFIVYWLPQMEGNTYNLITFQQESYTDNVPLTITPMPDSMLRVFMAWKPLAESVEIKEPVLEAFERTGFAVVEWGGAKVLD